MRPVAFALYAAGLVVVVGASQPLVHLAAAAVGGWLAWSLRRHPERVPIRRLITIGVVLGAIGWVLGPTDAATMLRSFLRRPADYVRDLGPGMLEGAVRTVAASVGGDTWLIPALAVLVGLLAGRLGPRAWVIPAASTPLFLLTAGLATLVPTTPEARWAASLPDAEPVPPLPHPPEPTLGPLPGKKIVVISVESIGADAIRRELETSPDGGLAALIRRSVFFPTAITAANVSHLSQPSIFTSHDFSHGLVRWFAPPDPAPVLTSMARYFHAKGLQTHFRSAEDESWLRMDNVMLTGQPWTSAREPVDIGKIPDPCGVLVALDSAVLAEVDTLLTSSPPEGLFTFAITQDSHWPYILEDAPDRFDTRAQCWWFVDLPAEELPNAERRYRAAVHETFERLARLVAAHPDTVFVLAGDHGEAMEAGRGFGHGKSTSLVEVQSFLMVIDPATAPALRPEPISLLDTFPTLIGRVAPEDAATMAPLLQGQDAIAGRKGPILTASHGFGEVEFALFAPPAAARRGPNTLRCDGPAAACDAADATLIRWLRCIDSYYADPPPGTTSPCRSTAF